MFVRHICRPSVECRQQSSLLHGGKCLPSPDFPTGCDMEFLGLNVMLALYFFLFTPMSGNLCLCMGALVTHAGP